MKVRTESGTQELRAVWFENGHLRLIDQRRLPQTLSIVETADWRRATEMIRDMTVRGAPAIGITAAYAMALALRAGEDPATAAAHVKSARPTAYDLFYAVDRIVAACAAGTGIKLTASSSASSRVQSFCTLFMESTSGFFFAFAGNRR